MPSDTFFRLPAEKRERIINAAWDEFTAVSYADVSINRIIRAAEIPRGSFYQYFEDRNDLFRYLTAEIKEYVREGYLAVLRENGGDIFRSALAAYDGVRKLYGTPGLRTIERCLGFFRMNPGVDLRKLTGSETDADWLEPFLEILDDSGFRNRESGFVRNCFWLCLMALGHPVLDSLAHPEHWEQNRAWLTGTVEIIKYGALAPAPANEIK